MSLTVNYVYTKKSDYSEFERANDTITAIVYYDATLIAGAESFTIELRKARRDRDQIVSTQTYTFAAPTSTDNLTFTFELPQIQDSTGSFRACRRGWYFIHVEDVLDDTNTKASEDFRIALITPERIKSQWLHGVTLKASDLVLPTSQPTQVTGVLITDVSLRHPAASYELTLNVKGTGSSQNKWLSWAGGKAKDLDLSHPLYPMKKYFLSGWVGAVGIEVMIDPLLLPSTDTVESINIDVAKLDDETIAQFIENATDVIENTDLQIYLEPTLCVSEVDPTGIDSSIGLDENTDYDRITTPITYFGVTEGHWAEIQFPFQYVLSLGYLFGAIAGNQVINVSTEWAEMSYQSGNAQLVPLQMEMAFNYLALMWAPSLWGIRDLPNFWHYRAYAGLRTVPNDLIELVARRACISILSVAGQAYRGGQAAHSVSKDGVAESVSYTSSAMYGIYSAYINDHQNWINERVAMLRNKYRGMMLRVL